MPELKDFEKFKNILTNLSGEPEWRAQRGEAIGDAAYMAQAETNPSTVPTESVSAQNESKFDLPPSTLDSVEEDFSMPSDFEMPEAPTEVASTPAVSESVREDFDIPSDFEMPEAPTEVASTPAVSESVREDFDIPSDFEMPEAPTEVASTPAAPESVREDFDTPSDFEMPEAPIEIANSDTPVSAASDTPTMQGDSSIPVSGSDDDLDDLDLPDVDELLSAPEGMGGMDFSFENEGSGEEDFYAELETPAIELTMDNIAKQPAKGVDSRQEEEEAPAAAQEAPASRSESEDEEQELPTPKVSSSFDLTDFGDAIATTEKKKAPVSSSAANDDDDDDEITGELRFRKYDIDQIEKTLNKLPRNLKIGVEEVLASPETSLSAVKKLTEKLIGGSSARSIADEIRSITGRTIIVPLFYQKGSGAILQKRRRGFVHIFMTQAWPVLKKIALTMLITAGLLITGFHLLYRPGMAHYYYTKGYKFIEASNYEKAEQNFDLAFNGWKLGFLDVRGVRRQSWFYKYAEAYAQKRQFDLAVNKYESLLQYYPNSKKAYMTYAHFEGGVHGRYAEAHRIYTRYLTNIDPSAHDVLLAAGDNLFEWGAILPEKTEEARQLYADLQYKIGKLTPTLGIRFLRYAIRVDNRAEIERWSRYFLSYMSKKRNFNVDPVAFSELASWYLDNNEPGVAREILDMAMKKDSQNPYVLYQMARYYSDGGLSAIQEEEMLQRTHYRLMQYKSLTWQQTEILVDVYRRLGLLYMSENKTAVSEENFQKSITTYEDAVRGKVLVPREKFGRIYKEFGDLYYNKLHDYDSALIYFDKSLANFYDTSELRYKMGYVYFGRKNYDSALDNLYLSFENSQENVNVLFSYATALAEGGSYSTAEGIYDQLRMALVRLNNVDVTEDRSMTPQQKRKIEDMLAKTYNNLGVVRYWISESSREVSRYRTMAEKNLGQSVVYWDNLTRDPETRSRLKERNLAQTNFRALTYPPARLDLTLFSELPHEFVFTTADAQGLDSAKLGN
ncbi:MAG: periplasmic flagellar collar protein FlcA [Spirochaetia bacterium]